MLMAILLLSLTVIPKVVSSHFIYGPELTMECIIEGIPSPTAIWTKDNATLSSSEQIVVTLSSTGLARLRLSQVTIRDSGLYTCIARSDAGSTNRTLRIDFGCK